MSGLFIWMWIVGGAPAVVLGEVVRSENPRIARAGRIAFALLLGVDLLLAAVILSVGADAPSSHMTKGLWWVTIAIAGVPLALVSGFAAWRGYAGHRIPLVAATLTTAALYVVFPLAYTPATQPKLTRFGRFAHEHHLLGVLILLIPTLILLVDELRRRQPTADSESDGADFRSTVGAIPWRYFVGAMLVLLVLVWIAGTNGPGVVIGLGVLLGGIGLFLWRKHRSEMRSVLGDLKPPENP